MVQGMPEFVFANRAGLEMFETTSSSLQELAWDKTLDEDSLKLSYATFTQVLQQVRILPCLHCACDIRKFWFISKSNIFLLLGIATEIPAERCET